MLKKATNRAEKGTHELMSKKFISNPNIHNVMKDHKYMIIKAVIQNKMAPRNALDQPMKLGERSAFGAVKKVEQFVLEKHKKNVAKQNTMDPDFLKKGTVWNFYGLTFWAKRHMRVFYSHLTLITSEEHWREHIYVDMCHSLNDTGSYIGGISTVDAVDELSVLAVIYCKSENIENYI